MKRWVCIVALLTAALPGEVFAWFGSTEITLHYIARLAEERARKPFHSPAANLPAFLRADQLTYDKYRQIEFRPDKALWASEHLPFRVEFFHPGYLYNEPVHINEFTTTSVQPVRFVQDWFNYRGLRLQQRIPPDLGYAGFKVLYQLNETNKWDELGAFLGASYFRLLGKGQRYGESARGLALDCGEPDRPEEFPIFTDWWLGKPHPGDDRLRLYAILDSVSCVGAYGFLIQPGETTIADVEAILYFREPKLIHEADPKRKPLKTLGMAPLTSMFWFGKSSDRRFDDYRPEVHDSDGLLMHMANGEILWHPLNDPPRMTHERFEAKDIRGFGLMQRARSFSTYQDLFNRYDLVPSVWVEPHGQWGDGEVNLVELPTDYEGLDNVVAFWDPKAKPAPLQPFRFAYTLYWTREKDMSFSENKVVATRVGVDPRAPQEHDFAIDFSGPLLGAIPANAPPQAIASCSTNAAIVVNQVFANPFCDGWRVMLKMEPKPGNQAPVSLRCTLQKGEKTLSETWTYLWSPP